LDLGYKQFAERLNNLKAQGADSYLSQSLFGLEREALRVATDGYIAQTPHPPALG